MWQDASADASRKISKALYEMVDCALPSQDCGDLVKSMQLCDSGPNNHTEWTSFYTAIRNAYWQAGQYSYLSPIVWPISDPIGLIVNETLAANDSSGAILRVPAMLKNWQLNSSECLDWRSNNVTSSTDQVGLQLRPFNYINCAYFNY